MTNLKGAGYIVYTDEAIYGTGDTVEAAWKDAAQYVDGTEPEYADEDTRIEAMERAGFKLGAATQALIDQVRECGGDKSWAAPGASHTGIVHCTEGEEAALYS